MVLVIAAVAWLAYRGLQARTALTSAATQVGVLQTAVLDGERTTARTTLTNLQDTTQQSRDLTSDPVWRLAGHVPWLGPNFTAVSSVAVAVDDLADIVLPEVLDATSDLQLRGLTPVNGRIDLDPIAAAAPAVATAAAAAARIDANLAAVDEGDLLAVVAGPVVAAQASVGELAGLLGTAESATTLLPPMLGADGPRRYLLLLQTNSELRATGGLPGSLSIVTAVDGQMALVEQVPASAMPRYETSVLDLAPEDAALYTTRLGRYMGDVNLSPDFATTAGLAAEMWRRHSGEQVDGVLATDPVALSYLLKGTGPVADGLGGTLTAENAADVLLSDVYETVADGAAQNTYFASVAANVFTALVGGGANPTALMSALSQATAEHRLLVWSTDATEQDQLAGTAVAGVLPTGPGSEASVGVFYNDGTESKMDYHLDTEIEPVAVECSATNATYVVRIGLVNSAPADAATSLPAAVTGPGASGVPAGGIRTNVVVLGPPGGEIVGVSRDGGPIGVGAYEQDERPATVVTVELMPGEAAVLDVELSGNRTADELTVWSTPTKDQSGLLSSGLSCAADS